MSLECHTEEVGEKRRENSEEEEENHREDKSEAVSAQEEEDRKRRDEENPMYDFKSYCDGLVDAGVVPDDIPKYMTKLMPRQCR